MYIKIFGKSQTTKGIKISNLGHNADDILLKIEDVKNGDSIKINLGIFHNDNYINYLIERGNTIDIPNHLSFDNPEEKEHSYIIAARFIAEYISDQFDLVENTDFVLIAEPEWDDSIANMGVRITMSNLTILQTYDSLIQLVKLRESQGVAIVKRTTLNTIMYFENLSPEHAFIQNDENVLVEFNT